MAHILPAQAQGWAEGTKLTISTLDANLETQITNEVFAQLVVFDSSGWTNESNTPPLVQTIIAKLYVAWVYDRQYSEDVASGTSDYSLLLKANAQTLIAGLNAGTIALPGIPGTSAGFYPTDASSAQVPTSDDPSLGPAAFSMGMTF